MQKFDQENGSVGRDTKKTIKLPIANQQGSSSENVQNSSKEKKEREEGYVGKMLALQVRFFLPDTLHFLFALPLTLIELNIWK